MSVADPSIAALHAARRINVTGNVGVGKSTVACALGRHLDLHVVHLDPLVWEAGWRKRAQLERDELVLAAAAEPRWIIDGVSAAVRARADAIVFVDLPMRVAIRRAITRAARLGFRSRPELGPGFPELRALRPAVRLARRFDAHVRPGIVADLPTVPMAIHLTSVAEASAFLRALEAGRDPA